MELHPGVEAIPGYPAVYVRQAKTLIVADLHLGFEEEMKKQGVFLPRMQWRKIKKILEELLETIRPEKVVIAGDVKHRFDGLSWQERREASELLELLTSRGVEVVLVRGNHDNYLVLVAKKYGLELVKEYWVTPSIAVAHGHEEVEARPELLIIGHEHPSVSLRDSIGFVEKVKCFLKAPLKRGGWLLVLPALSIYATGTSVTLDPSSYLSPIIREEAVLEKAKPFIVSSEVGVLEFPELKALAEVNIVE